MKTAKIIFWVSTGFIFLFEGVMPAFTGHSELAIEGITSLGYPSYFVTVLVVAKVLGTLALILPFVSPRIKEWAYVGLGITMLSAFVSHWVVNGLQALTFFPLVVFAILVVSYRYYHKLLTIKAP